MPNVKVIDIPLTREHAVIALKALRFYADNGDGNEEWGWPGIQAVREEIHYFEAIIKFYDAAEVLNGN